MSDPACPEAEFRRAFRMRRSVFDKLCDDLAPPSPSRCPNASPSASGASPPASLSARCHATSASASPPATISSSRSAALTAVLLVRVMRWPDYHAAAASGFEALSGIPGVVGAVHTDHIPIVAPRENAGEYYDCRLTDRNQKATYSIAVQAAMDTDGAFTDVCIGHPGSLFDAKVLEKSALYAQCEPGLLLGDDHRNTQRGARGSSARLRKGKDGH
ncbi:hypothetical protein E2562_028210 [Oryza meyeriana var. granulata]|uniref:DDE Tnp4 domain-containing protein n=1 Tax=Oryza meyeriana var. granulata TaxID=110450 RepID=A0A6G1DP93_9ORYZ|nr:hypothetical protein E2562_028210 [Oryza meyeriana var. granulata]